MPLESGNDGLPPRRRRQQETKSPEELDAIFKAFEERAVEIRAALGAKGHLDLVTSSEFSDARRKLYEAAGEKIAEEHLSHWFNLHFS